MRIKRNRAVKRLRYLIYGAGTIGLTYGWLLSQNHSVDVLVKPEHFSELSQGVSLAVKDLRNVSDRYERFEWNPNCITNVTAQYDGILVAVNRCQLKAVLPALTGLRNHTGYFAFMQNNWNLKKELEPYFSAEDYIVAFPSSVGGGRDGRTIEVILFDEATRIGGASEQGVRDMPRCLNASGIKTEVDPNIFDWLKIHYLQQSITAGAVLEKGDFLSFAQDYQAVKKMVRAFREGIAVCQSCGVPTRKVFPANLFRLPIFLVAHMMQKMFLEQNTVEMVTNHMKKGMPEWAAGYQEVLTDGLGQGHKMLVWKSYGAQVEKYLKSREEGSH